MVRTSLNSFNLNSLRRGQGGSESERRTTLTRRRRGIPFLLLLNYSHSCKHTLVTQQDHLWHVRPLPSFFHIPPPLFPPFPPSFSLHSAVPPRTLTYYCSTASRTFSVPQEKRSRSTRDAGRNSNLFLRFGFPSTSPSTLSAHLLDSLQFPQCSSSSQSATGN
jgi:hypothetical protein